MSFIKRRWRRSLQYIQSSSCYYYPYYKYPFPQGSSSVTVFRPFSSTEGCHPKNESKTVSFTYILRNGDEKVVNAELGKHLLDVAHDNNIELEGACGGELACATCHLVFEDTIYPTLPEKKEEEDDMLDLAFGLTKTSRLGCQIRVRDDFEGMKVTIPDDGF
jgi:ferredoxin